MNTTMDRPRINLGCAAPLLMFALWASVAGCVDQGGGVVIPVDPSKPGHPVPVVAATSEREFLIALARAVVRGDFDDTDKLQIAMRRSAKNLGLDSEKLKGPLNAALGDLGANQSLTDANVRSEMAERLKKAAEQLK